MIPADSASDQSNATRELSLAESPFLHLLERAQNEDGGWGFQPGRSSRVEPTCWALLALLQLQARENVKERLSRGVQFLRASQLSDGSWPAAPAQETGCWVTSLACWALLAAKDSSGAAEKGLHWLCDDWPKDSSPWRRFIAHFFHKDIARHNDSYRGWGWTPRTASWVEPTAFALIAMSQCPPDMLPRSASRRRHLAKFLLYDRMCPGGGWNCGNPRTYGVAGESLIIPTVWALLALRNQQGRSEVEASLAWLEKNLLNIRSGASLALARICLETFGRSVPIHEQDVRTSFDKNEFLENVPVTAWASLACNARPHWLAVEVPETA
ncbi:MAG TPA: prenyltransferase/squalene oxidase repeat-containing protein [Candidatus Acidoferrales bacterium]|nr:prenyltransferase/squalene oxidase repeat-containing protein [Candidatus Acidoferrales bacterium]